MFGVMELDQGMEGARFALGVRNSHDKTFRLAITVGYRVFVCENLAFHGDYSPVLAKHSKHFSLQNALSIGVDQMQRKFDGKRMQGGAWREIPLHLVHADGQRVRSEEHTSELQSQHELACRLLLEKKKS